MKAETPTPDPVETAAQLAALGRYDAAEQILERLPEEEKRGAACAVLRAKIKAQRGRPADAIELWRSALEADPSNRAALEGLALSSALAGRGSNLLYLRAHLLYALLGILLLLLSGALVWAIRGRDGRGTGGAKPQGATVAGGQTTNPRPAPDLVAEARGESASDPNAGFAAQIPRILAELEALHEQMRRLQANPFAAAPPAPDKPDIAFSVQGVTVRKDAVGGMDLVFEEGLFERKTALKLGAMKLLADLARQIEPHAGRVALRIIGFSDGTPFVGDGDHRSLGFLRALRVAEVLQESCHLPPEAVSIGSHGQMGLPFPDAPAGQGKNRTVVIRVTDR